MNVMIRSLGLGILLAVLASGWAAGVEQKAPVGDISAVQWVYPGDFDTALKRCHDEKRLLIFKTVMFGVDQEGATCATKGHW